MICQEIKLYVEPEPVVYPKLVTTYTGYHGYKGGKTLSHAEFEAARKKAIEKFRIGDCFQYSTGSGLIQVVKFETNIDKAEIYDDNPGVIVCKKIGPGIHPAEYNYSIEELDAMVKVVNDD